ncbi:MAG TPA: hypothetical protein ENN08_06395, partial [Bacteroidales bacterium]|nr:hypothetical protein [Bacteroidales bacterium]
MIWGWMPWIFTVLLVIAGLVLKADNLNKQIRQLKPGMDEAGVVAVAGTPKEVVPVERWFYKNENQVVISNNRIIDIRLNPD